MRAKRKMVRFLHLTIYIYISTVLYTDLYIVTYMYAFRAGNLILDSHLVCSSLDKTFSSSQHFLVACNSWCRIEASWIHLQNNSHTKGSRIIMEDAVERQ